MSRGRAEGRRPSSSELEAALATWKADIATMTQSLIDLGEHPTFKALMRSDDGAPRLFTGRSAAEIDAAKAGVQRLWTHLGHLRALVERAVKAHASLPVLGRGKAIAEIHGMLTEPSIVLSEEATPLAERGLLGPAVRAERTTPEALKASMTAAFQQARAVLVAVEDAWTAVGRELGEAYARIATLRQEHEALGLEVRELDEAVKRLAAMDAAIHEDPLSWGPAEIAARLAPEMERVQRLSVSAAAEVEAVRAEVARGRAKLDRLLQARVECLEAFEHCRREVREPPPAPASFGTKDLATALGELEEACAARRYDGVSRRLREWREAYADRLSSMKASTATNRGLIERRRELRQRWATASASANGHSALGTDRALAAFARKAASLFESAVALDEADRIVYAFETRVGELLGPHAAADKGRQP